MNIIGIVCEYNPFHNGHLYQINKIKELYKDSLIIVCMSSSFTQRGELSILNKFDKTNIALENGIDIVVELPYIYSTQSADIFAKYSIELLNHLNIDTLVFGSETKNLNDLIKAAKIQINNKDYNKYVKEYLDNGLNYPTALNKALEKNGSLEIKNPNDLLGISYIKEIIKNNYNIDIKNIERTNNFHDISLNSNIVSASNIRNRLLSNIDIKNQVPLNTYTILKDKNIKNNKYFEYLKYKIISDNDLSKYLDVDEGIDNRIKKVINNSNSLDDLIKNIKSKRYTYNKISRMLNHILCSFTKEENIKELEYIRILGFNNKGKKYLNKIKKDIKLPILNSYNTNYKTLDVEKRVTSIYSLIYENIMEEELSNKPIQKAN